MTTNQSLGSSRVTPLLFSPVHQMSQSQKPPAPDAEALNTANGPTPTKKRRTPADPNKPKTKRTKSSTTVSSLVQNIDAANQAQMAEAAKSAENTASAPAAPPAAEDKTVNSNTTSGQSQPSPPGSDPVATEAPITTTAATPTRAQQFETNHSPSLFINQKLFESSAENSPAATAPAKVEAKLDSSGKDSATESDRDLISSYSTAKYSSPSEPSGKLEYHLSADSSTVSVRLPGSISAQTSALSISSSLSSSSSSASSSSSELEMDDLISKTAHPSKPLTTGHFRHIRTILTNSLSLCVLDESNIQSLVI